MTTSFSVILPTHNRCHLIGDAIESVLRQTVSPLEVIVVDDGSTDETRSYLRKHYGFVRVISQEQCGPGAARNAGVDRAQGDYICFLDSDDVWYPWTLDIYRQAIERFGATFVAGVPRHLTIDGGIDEEWCPVDMKRYDSYFHSSKDGVWIGTCGVAIRKMDFFAVNGFRSDRANAEDSDLWLMLGDRSPFVHIRKPAAFGYRRQTQSLTAQTILSAKGVQGILRRERAGIYPGGRSFASCRSDIICAHVRPVVLQCLKEGHARMGLSLFFATFGAHLRLRRWRFLIWALPKGLFLWLVRFSSRWLQ